MQPYEKAAKLPRKDIIVNNFLGGIAWGLGATIGLSLVLALLGFVLSKINFIPVLGNFVSQVMTYTQHNRPL